MRLFLVTLSLLLLAPPVQAETQPIEALVQEVAANHPWGEAIDMNKVSVEVVSHKRLRRIWADFTTKSSGANHKGPLRRMMTKVGVAIVSRALGPFGMYLPSTKGDNGTLYLVKEELTNHPNRTKAFITHELTHAAQHQTFPETYQKTQKLLRRLASGGNRKAIMNEIFQLRMLAEGQAVVMQLGADPNSGAEAKAKTVLGRLKQGLGRAAVRAGLAASKTLRNVAASYSVGMAIAQPELSGALWNDGEFRNNLLGPTIDAMNKVSGWRYLFRGNRVYKAIAKDLAARAEAVIETGDKQQAKTPTAEHSRLRDRARERMSRARTWLKSGIRRMFKPAPQRILSKRPVRSF